MSGTDGPGRYRDTPNRVPWPPVIYLAAIALALAIETIWPSPPVSSRLGGGVAAIGWLVVLLGGAADLWAMLTLARARANILPHRAATRLVTWGPFRLSRNPIYLGNTLMTAGAGLAFGKLWLVPAALLAAVATYHLAIRREEAHLEARFGAAWHDYAARTPRWLGARA